MREVSKRDNPEQCWQVSRISYHMVASMRVPIAQDLRQATLSSFTFLSSALASITMLLMSARIYYSLIGIRAAWCVYLCRKTQEAKIKGVKRLHWKMVLFSVWPVTELLQIEKCSILDTCKLVCLQKWHLWPKCVIFCSSCPKSWRIVKVFLVIRM